MSELGFHVEWSQWGQGEHTAGDAECAQAARAVASPVGLLGMLLQQGPSSKGVIAEISRVESTQAGWQTEQEQGRLATRTLA